MFTRVVRLLYALAQAQPISTLIGAASLCTAVIIAGTGTSALRTGRQRREARSRMAGLALPGTTLLLFGLVDWLLLRALPLLRLSFSSDIAVPFVASAIVRLATFGGLISTSLVALGRARRRGTTAGTTASRGLLSGGVILFLATNLAFSAVQVEAYVIEPLWVETTELSLRFGNLDPAAPPVRIVHLADIHIERYSYREARIVQRVKELQPDIIVLTGDYLNLSRLEDPVSAAHLRQFASQLHAPYGVYAVRGTVEPTTEQMAWLVQETQVIWLEQESVSVDVRGQPVTIVGVACSHRRDLDTTRLDRALAGIPGDAFTLLLYHSPDLIEQAAERHIDLYLGGHTHGGQLRLPLYGAIATGSNYGKAFEAGLYERGDTNMYVSRGIGLEGGSMPRARFLCRPEIVHLEVGG